MKAFMDCRENKQAAIARAVALREAGAFYAWGHHWCEGKGDVTGGMYHPYLQPGEVEQDCPKYSGAVHGIHWRAAELIDVFFHGLALNPDKQIHQTWAERVYETIRPGADITPVPDRLISYILERPEWLASYADEKGAHMVGMMQGIITLRRCAFPDQLNGIDQEKRIKDLYYDHIHKLHMSRFQGERNPAYFVNAAMRSLCEAHLRRGTMGYFLHNVVQARAGNNRAAQTREWADLSMIFLKLIEDC